MIDFYYLCYINLMVMEKIKGLNVDFNFSSLTKVADLIYFDGPLLAHYTDADGNNYLFYWVDVDEKYNRWIVLKTDLASIRKYMNKEVTLHSIITHPSDGVVYIVDIDDNNNYRAKSAAIKDLPIIYTPNDEYGKDRL